MKIPLLGSDGFRHAPTAPPLRMGRDASKMDPPRRRRRVGILHPMTETRRLLDAMGRIAARAIPA